MEKKQEYPLTGFDALSDGRACWFHIPTALMLSPTSTLLLVGEHFRKWQVTQRINHTFGPTWASSLTQFAYTPKSKVWFFLFTPNREI